MTTQYFDGLGRPIQQVVKKGAQATGATAADLVTPFLYDGFGRQSISYPTFVANSTAGNTSVNDGLFKLNAFQQDSAFSSQTYLHETYYYQQIIFESSPLSRVQKTMPAGNSWVGSGRGTEKQYEAYLGHSTMRHWQIAMTEGSMPTSSDVYPSGSLLVEKTFDEHGNPVVEYKDKSGRLLLKSVYNTPDWMLTYYVYDEMGRLRCVIPPKATQAIWSNWIK